MRILIQKLKRYLKAKWFCCKGARHKIKSLADNVALFSGKRRHVVHTTSAEANSDKLMSRLSCWSSVSQTVLLITSGLTKSGQYSVWPFALKTGSIPSDTLVCSFIRKPAGKVFLVVFFSPGEPATVFLKISVPAASIILIGKYNVFFFSFPATC